ncbi:MAG: imidazole glycerol phosphate synthase subunit HisH [Bacteroidales bacterium]
MKIVIVNFGQGGNSAAIKNMLSRIGYESRLSTHKQDISDADKIILPGVGAFDTAINGLRDNNLWDEVLTFVSIRKKPVLGICLGFQILCNGSEEGNEQGFSFLNAYFHKFPKQMENKQILKTPHLGWNEITNISQETRLYKGIENPRFYFVHSYYCLPQKDYISAYTNYGISFCCSLEHDNIAGVQFHPEKSHKYGMKLLKNFIELF